MKPYQLYFPIVLALVMVSTAATGSELEQGIKWYEKHVEYVNLEDVSVNPEPFDTAIKHFEQALDNAETGKEAGRYLLHTYYLKGTYAVDSAEAKQEIFAKGKKLGERLIEKYPDNVDFHILYAANLGRWGEAYGIVSAAREGVAGTIRKEGERVIELDETAQGAAGYRILAQVHHKAPNIPFVLNWPSTRKALDYLRKALKIAPDHPANNALYGKYLHYQGKTEEALEYLRKTANMSPRKQPPYLLDDARYISMAKDLLEEISS
ncbi:MAG: tetratricopeptide repeat protein [bacterium]